MRDIDLPDYQQPFIAVDWGTTSFRLWHLCGSGTILDQISGPYGMSGLSRAEFATVLEDQLNRLSIAQHIPVLVCGMAGAAQGWCEAPYITAPTSLMELDRQAVKVPDYDREVYILPGIRQMDPANVMRGEETQLLGLLVQQPDYHGVVCLPGTHSKWVYLNAGRIEHFTTCMTGELFSLLSKQSLLKYSITDDSWDSDLFIKSVEHTLRAPERFADSLFNLRADDLVLKHKSVSARARLSGMLLGLEFAATRRYWEHHTVALIGESELCIRYADVFATCVGSDVITVDSEAATLCGLASAFKNRQTRTS